MGEVHDIVIAERSEANNRDLWASESQLAFIYIYIYISSPNRTPKCNGYGCAEMRVSIIRVSRETGVYY